MKSPNQKWHLYGKFVNIVSIEWHNFFHIFILIIFMNYTCFSFRAFQKRLLTHNYSNQNSFRHLKNTMYQLLLNQLVFATFVNASNTVHSCIILYSLLPIPYYTSFKMELISIMEDDKWRMPSDEKDKTFKVRHKTFTHR